MPIVPPMEYSDLGIALTKGYEGLRLTSYQDVAGVWTIGYGHTGSEVAAGQTVDEARADLLLKFDMAQAVKAVNLYVNVLLLQTEFDALVDFAFNCGIGTLKGSTLLRKVNVGDMGGAVAEFGKWVHAGGEVVPGLVRRRREEASLFATKPNVPPTPEEQI